MTTQILCNVAGQCQQVFAKAANLAQNMSVMAAQAATALPVIGPVVQGMATVASKKYEYDLLRKEAEYARGLYKGFEDLVLHVENIQKNYGFVICSLTHANQFKQEFGTLLQLYSTQVLNKVQQLISPEWYRLQLQYYLSFLSNFTTLIQNESMRLIMQFHEIENNQQLTETERRDRIHQLIETSRQTCSTIPTLPMLPPANDVPLAITSDVVKGKGKSKMQLLPPTEEEAESKTRITLKHNNNNYNKKKKNKHS